MAFSEPHYSQIALAIEYFREHQQQQPSLAEIARHVGISEYHFQRLFSEWVGISPKKFLQFLTKERALEKLRTSSLMEVALEVGLSGAGRLHDLILNCEGVTPGQYKAWGAGLDIHYGVHESPFGYCFLAQTDRGLCKCAFVDTAEQADQLIKELHTEWPQASIQRQDAKTAGICEMIFPRTPARITQRTSPSLHLLLKGSKFQLKVWEALLRIPAGELVSYQQVAQEIGAAGATRAVASAVAQNKLGYLIPCHRVIRSTGEFNQYRWGSTRKMAIIGWEASHSEL